MFVIFFIFCLITFHLLCCASLSSTPFMFLCMKQCWSSVRLVGKSNQLCLVSRPGHISRILLSWCGQPHTTKQETDPWHQRGDYSVVKAQQIDLYLINQLYYMLRWNEFDFSVLFTQQKLPARATYDFKAQTAKYEQLWENLVIFFVLGNFMLPQYIVWPICFFI